MRYVSSFYDLCYIISLLCLIDLLTDSITTMNTYSISSPQDIAFTTTGLLTYVLTDSQLLTMPVEGGATSVLAEQGGVSMVVHPETGMVYITDSKNHCIVTCTALGQIMALAGNCNGTVGNIDGEASVATFDSPFGIVMDPTSIYLYVTCNGAFTVRRVVVSTGHTTTLAGSGVSGKSDGQGLFAQFFSPTYVYTVGKAIFVILYVQYFLFIVSCSLLQRSCVVHCWGFDRCGWQKISSGVSFRCGMPHALYFLCPS